MLWPSACMKPLSTFHSGAVPSSDVQCDKSFPSKITSASDGALPACSCVLGVPGWMLVGAAILHLIPRLGAAGRRMSDALCRAPLLDVTMTYFTVLPLLIGPLVAGWIGLAGAALGQVVGVILWMRIHELANRKHTRG